MSALSRYYLNNFHDGIRQVCIIYHRVYAFFLFLIIHIWVSQFYLDGLILSCFNSFPAGFKPARTSELLPSWCATKLFLFQDAMDLISGRYTVNRNSPSPFQLNGFESFSVSNISIFPLFFFLSRYLNHSLAISMQSFVKLCVTCIFFF